MIQLIDPQYSIERQQYILQDCLSFGLLTYETSSLIQIHTPLPHAIIVILSLYTLWYDSVCSFNNINNHNTTDMVIYSILYT